MRLPQHPCVFAVRLTSHSRRPGMLLPIGQMAASIALALLVGACETPPPGHPAPGTLLTHEQTNRMPLEKNITAVGAFYDPYSPWIWNEDRSKMRGLIVNALYLIGPDSMGVFGDGIIRPHIYVLEGAEGKETPKLVKEWLLDPEQAMEWRARKRTAMGWGYQLQLVWGDELDFRGKRIRITISFERTDGRVVHSAKKDFRVPA